MECRCIGPHRDVIGSWAAAARKQGLRFGVTVHQARNWWWFQPSHGGDTSGTNLGFHMMAILRAKAKISGGKDSIPSDSME